MNKQWNRLHELADQIGIAETLNILERAHGTSGSTLSDRWTPAQKELAYKVSNDISEDIDCKESRAQLRQCVAVYADLYFDLVTQREATASTELLRELKKICERVEHAKALRDIETGLTR